MVAIENSQEFPEVTDRSVSYCTKFMLDPVEVPIVICPPVANTASPSFIAFPEILINPQNSSPAPSQANAIDKLLMLETFVGTVNELLTLAPAKLSNAVTTTSIAALVVVAIENSQLQLLLSDIFLGCQIIFAKMHWCLQLQ